MIPERVQKKTVEHEAFRFDPEPSASNRLVARDRHHVRESSFGRSGSMLLPRTRRFCAFGNPTISCSTKPGGLKKYKMRKAANAPPACTANFCQVPCIS